MSAEQHVHGAVKLEPVSFDQLPGWDTDDLVEAFKAFLSSCPKLTKSGDPRLQNLAKFALNNPATDPRQFFKTYFVPHKVVWAEKEGLVTGYFEPILQGSWEQSDDYPVPLYQRPPDLVSLIDDKERAKFNAGLSYVRRTCSGDEPYPTRQDIECGALTGLNLELLYLKDKVDAYFLHVQGSGRVNLPDGNFVRVSYAAKNGHPYSSIGKILIARNHISPEDMSLQAVQHWLRSNEQEAREIMWQNKSYIFFRCLEESEAEAGPRGAADVPLTPECSLAVDASIHDLNLPIWVTAPSLDLNNKGGFHKLMIAHDVGSAIRGPERGDIYWGSGDEAGSLAGRTNHPANFFTLLPREIASPL